MRWRATRGSSEIRRRTAATICSRLEFMGTSRQEIPRLYGMQGQVRAQLLARTGSRRMRVSEFLPLVYRARTKPVLPDTQVVANLHAPNGPNCGQSHVLLVIDFDSF